MRPIETNLPQNVSEYGIGDDYLAKLYRRPDDWRLKRPELTDLKEENIVMRDQGHFQFGTQLRAPTLNSFAAFADGSEWTDAEVDAELSGGVDDYSIPELSSHQEGSPTSSAARSTDRASSNLLSDLLSGVIKAGATVGTAYLTKSNNTGVVSASKTGTNTVYTASAGAKPAAGVPNTALIIGGIAALALVFVMVRK